MRFILLLTVFLITAVQATAQEQPVALVTSNGGKSDIKAPAGGAVTDASVGAELRPGDVLTVRTGTTSIVFMAGDFLEVQAGEQLTVGATASASKLADAGGTRGVTRDETVAVPGGSIARQQGKDALSQLAIASGIRGDAMPVAVSPRLVLSDPNPLFCWFDTDSSASGKTRTYTIIIRDAENAVVAQKDVEGAVYRMNSMRADKLGAGLKPVPEKRYTWAVYEQGKVPNPLPAFDAFFMFADKGGLEKAAQKREELQALFSGKKIDEQSYHTLSVLAYSDDRERLFADAFQHLLVLAASPTSSRFAVEQFARILPRFGNQTTVVAAILGGRR